MLSFLHSSIFKFHYDSINSVLCLSTGKCLGNLNSIMILLIRIQVCTHIICNIHLNSIMILLIRNEVGDNGMKITI